MTYNIINKKLKWATYSIAGPGGKTKWYLSSEQSHKEVLIREKEYLCTGQSTTPYHTNFMLEIEQPTVNDDRCHEATSIPQRIIDSFEGPTEYGKHDIGLRNAKHRLD